MKVRSQNDACAVERDLIGRLVINPDLIDEHGIQREWFTLPESLLTLEAIDEVIRGNEQLSIPTLTAKLRDMTGGHDHLKRVVSWKSNAIPEHQLPEKISFLKREYTLREAHRCLSDLQQQVALGSFSPEQAASMISGLSSESTSQYEYSGEQVSKKAIAHLVEVQNAAKKFGDITGITTGIADLDKLTGGLQFGDLIILAAQPSMGKTALSISWVVAQLIAGWKVGFFASDMPANKIAIRVFAAHSNFNLHHAKNLPDDRTEAEMVARGIAEGSKFLSSSDFHINDKGGITISEVERQARQWHRLHGLDIIYIDYIQRIRHDNQQMEKRMQVTDITERLKNLAKDLNITVVGLAQTNRATASRSSNNKRPVIQDLAESAAIEREACLIIFPFRESVFDESVSKEKAEIIVAKHQDGPTGTIHAYWDAKCAAFRNAVDPWGHQNYG